VDTHLSAGRSYLGRQYLRAYFSDLSAGAKGMIGSLNCSALGLRVYGMCSSSQVTTVRGSLASVFMLP